MSHIQERLALFHDKSFCFYLLSALCATFGNGLTYVTMTWLSMGDSHHVAHITIMMSCFWGPSIVIGPFAGVIVDRFSRWNLIFFCNMIRLVALVIFSGSYYFSTGFSVYILALVLGCMGAIFLPTAATFIREIIPKEQLLHANATLDIIYEIGCLVGMGGAGFILYYVAPSATFLINAICFLLASLLLFGIRYQPGKSHKRYGPVKELCLATRYLKKRGSLQLIYVLQVLLFISYMTTPVLLAPFIKDFLHKSSVEYGIIESVLSLGVVAGGILTPYFCERYGFAKTVFAELVVGAVSFYGFSHSQHLLWAAFWYFLVGFIFSIWAVFMTKAQSMTVFGYQGRIIGLFNAIASLVTLLFYIALGALDNYFSLVSLFYAQVVLMLIGLITLFYFLKAQRTT